MTKPLVLFLLPLILNACVQPAPPTSPTPAARAQEPPPALPTQPAQTQARRPALPLPRVAAGAKFPQLVLEGPVPGPGAARNNPADFTFVAGFLLVPIEQSPLYRKPDAFFVFRHGEIRMFSAPDFTEKWPAFEIPENTPVVHLGSAGDISVFVQESRVFGLDTAKGNIRWQFDLTMSEVDRTRAAKIQAVIRDNQMKEIQKRAGAAGSMIYDPQTGTYYNAGMSPAALALDPDVGRNVTFSERLSPGQTQFSTMRMLGSRLFIVNGSSLLAHDLATGERSWKNPEVAALPDGLPIAIVGNDNLVIVQVDDENTTPTFRIFDAATGKSLGDIRPGDKEHSAWRGLSKNGILFVITDKSVAAYNCRAADPAKPLWRRDDIEIKWAAASAITSDGLVLVDAQDNLLCLAADTGKTRWPLPPAAAPRLFTSPLKGFTPKRPDRTFLRSYVDPEAGQVIFQTNSDLAAYYTANGKESWLSSFCDSIATYSLTNSQLADPFIVTLATGPRADGSLAALIVSHDSRPEKGKLSILDLGKPNNAAPARDPPIIRNWQVVDNAIIMETMGKTYLYKAKPEK